MSSVMDTEKAKIVTAMKMLLCNAEMVRNMLKEGHNEAAAIIQDEFIEQYTEVYNAVREHGEEKSQTTKKTKTVSS